MDSSGSVYSFKDSIRLLKISLSLRRVIAVGGDTPITQIPTMGSIARGLDRLNLSRQESRTGLENLAAAETEEYTFTWQEKVFSQKEFNKYSDPEKCITVLQKQYHEEIRSLGGQRPNKRLFTYIEGDEYQPKEHGQNGSASPSSGSNVWSDRIAVSTNRRIAPFSALASLASSRNPVLDHPTEETKKKARAIPYNVKTMWIMADFNGGADTDEDEHVLCVIKIINNEHLFICPDFSTHAYKIESRIGVFNYVITNLSPNLVDEGEFTTARVPRVFDRFIPITGGTEFDVPEDGVIKLLLVGEIRSAKYFEYDNIYIHYFIDLPDGWYNAQETPLFGLTQTGKKSWIENEGDVIYYSCSFEFALCYNLNPYRLEPGQLPQWPQLFVEALSEDSWGRFRAEGYGFTTIPTEPGNHNVKISTWRPLAGSSRVEELQRFFIGGGAELHQPIQCKFPDGGDKKRMSKYGFRTVSSGEISLNFRIIKQCRAYIRKGGRVGASGEQDHHLFGLGRHNSVIAVLEAFQKARQRMIAIRDSIYAEQGLLLA